jgi:aryl-alcohol dehydrogenase-like predicted oxidoreductase
MEYKNLTGTSIRISQLCLGTMMFGGQTNAEDSLRIMDYAFDQGINFFDTANAYSQGESERIVGLGIKGRRDQIILATKVRGKMGDNPNDAGLSRRNILAAVDASLKRLNSDYIDLYYMHQPDYDTSLEESLDTMSGLVRSGKVRYIGISNYAAWQIADMLAICEKHGYIAPIMTQNVYNLITRGVERELIPFLKEHKMGLVNYNPIAAGLLAGKHKPGQPMENTRFSYNKEYFDRYWSNENFEAVEKLTEVATENGLSILQLAMKWCAAQKSVTSIITGMSRLDQLKQNIASIEGEPLDDAILAQCDLIWQSLAGTRFQYNR